MLRIIRQPKGSKARISSSKISQNTLYDHISGSVALIHLQFDFLSTGSECDEEEVDFEESDSDESWTTESAISSESILSSMCMNGGDEKPFACPVPGCKKRYKVGFTQHLSL